MTYPAKKVTVASLARELSLSTCTVSKILNRSFDGFTYAPETIRKVENAARKRGYVPNAHARSLRTKKSMLIGLIVPSGIPFFSGTLVENIERELRPHGYETIVGHSLGDKAQEVRLMQAMIGKGVDGLLWIPHGKALRPGDLKIDASFPLVLLDRPGCWGSFPTVVTENETASEELARGIREAGHKSLVMVTSHSGDDSILERESGIRRVFGKAITEVISANEIAAAREVVSGLANKLEGRVLVCLTQNLALGALGALMESNLFVGVDVGFASFDDLPLCEIWQPSLTRIQQNMDLLARESVRLIVEKIQQPATKQPLEVRIPADLIWGHSVMNLRPVPKTEIAAVTKR